MDEKKLIEDYELELCQPECVPGAPVYSVKAHIPNDVSEVMPYLNAVLDRPLYGGDNEFIIWQDEERKFALRPHELAISTAWSREEANELARKAVAEINGVWARKEEIIPDYETRKPPQALEVFKLLPRTNCGDCGLKTCMAFAAATIDGSRRLEDCPPLLEVENEERVSQLRALGL